jgi:hypothetical protein
MDVEDDMDSMDVDTDMDMGAEDDGKQYPVKESVESKRVIDINNEGKITAWLKKSAGLPTDASVYFDDSDLVWGSETIVDRALVNQRLTLGDLLKALKAAVAKNPTGNDVEDDTKMSMEEAVSLKSVSVPVKSEEGNVNKKSVVAANAGAKGAMAKPVHATGTEAQGRPAPGTKELVGKVGNTPAQSTQKPTPATKPNLSQATGVNTRSVVK